MMNKMFKSINYYLGLNYLFTSLPSLALLASGFSNYRYLIVVTACFVAMFAAKILFNNIKTLEKISAICIIVSFLYDINYGPFNENVKNINIYLSAALVLVFEILFSKYKRIIIEKLSNNTVFSLCAKCHYESHLLMTTCSNCGFDPSAYCTFDIIDDNIRKISKTNVEIDSLFRENEIFSMKLGVFVPTVVVIDGSGVLLNKMLITNKRILFIRKGLLDRGYSFNKSFLLSTVSNMSLCDSIGHIKIGKSLKISTTDGHSIVIDSRRMFGKNDVYKKIINSIEIAQNLPESV